MPKHVVEDGTGFIDGNKLPAMSAAKKGGAPATGTPSGLFLRDDGTWQAAGGGGAHAGTHVTGGGDTIANAVSAGNAGLMSGADKTKLDGIASGAEVNVNADWTAVAGDAQILNKPTTMPPSAHDLGGAAHNADTLANLNLKISDADVPALAGQIGGTAASPDIRGIRETGGPTLLTLGAVADGEYLKRSAGTIVGGAGGSGLSHPQAMARVSMGA
jgi:hypothetical protein